MSSGILKWWISPEVEFTPVMTDFPSSAIERICGALNRLVSDVIINRHAQRRVMAKNVFDPFSLDKRLTCNIGMSLDNWYCENIKWWCYGTRGNHQCRNLQAEVYFEATRFCIARDKRQYFQVTHRAVGARTMHGFGTDLIRNPAIWLVESRD